MNGEKPIEVGDAVRLRGQAMPMTLVKYVGGGEYEVAWFNGGDLMRSTFPIVALEPFQEQKISE